MRIGIFVLAAGKGAGGPDTYEVQLVRALSQVDPRNTYRLYCTSTAAAQALEVNAPNFTCHILRPRSRWLSVPLSLPLALVRDRLDFFHATYTPPPLPLRPYVFTHYDNSPFTHPHYYNRIVLARLRPLIRLGLARARHIICISEFTRQKTAQKFSIPLDRMTAIPLGVDERYRPVDQQAAKALLRERYGVDAPYFLYVGKLQKSKNINRLLEAYGRVRARLKDCPRLVLAGKRTEPNSQMDAMLAQEGLSGRVHELGYVPDEHLPALYSAARALVFPTLYEGFGLPVIEAMACGTAVVTSNVCSLPEVAGDAALLVDPYSVEAIGEAMLRLATDDELVARLVSGGLKRAREFTWTENARRTLEVYRLVHERHRPGGRAASLSAT